MEKNVRSHHTLFQRTSWDSSQPTRRLRRNPSLIVPMEKTSETLLHEAISVVPLPDPHTALRTFNTFQPSPTYVGSIMNLITCLDEAIRHPRCSRLEKDLGGLTIYALELQLPYIRDGLIHKEVGYYGV